MSGELIQLRSAHSQDVGAIALVIARANAARDDKLLPVVAEDDQLSDLQQRMSTPNAWAYVATNDDKVVGFALGYPCADEKSSPGVFRNEYLSLLMVEPSSWNKGIASRLLAVVAERARMTGRNFLTLRTRDEDNDRTRRVYEHKGFRLTGVTKDSEYGQQVEYQLEL